MPSQVAHKQEIPLRIELIAFIILATTSLLLRLNNLSADPPIGLSISQGIYTDPAQYTHFARNFALYGSFNPMHDFRFIFFLKSSVTLMALFVFKLFGVGYMQSNLVGIFFSFPTVILFYFALRRVAGNLSALIFLIFISLNYNQLFYGRLSFLENALNFFAILAFTIIVYAKRPHAFFLSGVFLAAGIFFGKIIGMIYLFPFACFAVYGYFYDRKISPSRYLYRYGYFIAGFLGLLVFWYYFAYLPATENVAGYVQEQALDLYGAPLAFERFEYFIHKYVSFGLGSNLWRRMPVEAILAMGMILIFVFRAGFKKSWKNGLYGINPGIIFMIALSLAAYGALMIWNYRPLRYQTILFYPVTGLAAVFINTIISNFKTGLERKPKVLFLILLFIFSLIPIYQLLAGIHYIVEVPFYFEDNVYRMLIIGILVILIGVLMIRFGKRLLYPSRNLKNVVIITALLLTLIPNGLRYTNWMKHTTFNIVANSKDLAMILSPEAVVSGPYGPVFSLENRLMGVIHMFGTAGVDPTLFEKFPITHLLMDISNKELAEESYEEIFEKAGMQVIYNVGSRDVTLMRVAGSSPNITARNYILSDYEAALYQYSKKNMQAANNFMLSFLEKYPQSPSANKTSAVIAFQNGFPEDAVYFYKRALEFSPTDFNLHFRLGAVYIELYHRSRNAEYLDKAKEQFDLAVRYNPESNTLKKEIDEFLRGVNAG